MDATDDVFFAWSRDGISTTGLLDKLKDHYQSLAGAYYQTDMTFEARLFAEAVAELEEIEKQLQSLFTPNGNAHSTPTNGGDHPL